MIKQLALASLFLATVSTVWAGTDERYPIEKPAAQDWYQYFSAADKAADQAVDSVFEQLKTKAAATSVFPKAVCNTKVALEDLKSRIKNEVHPTWDGHLPWRGILGHFQNAYRDAHIEITARESTRSEFGIVRVMIRSICTGNMIAYGVKIISESEFKKPTLKLELKDMELVSINTNTRANPQFSAEITVEKRADESKKDTSTSPTQANWILINISETVETRDGKKIIPRDTVKALKLL